MTPTLTRAKILETARALPAAPQALSGLFELLQNTNSDLGRIADQIRVDPTLAAAVIRIGNSPAFGAGWEIGSVDEAVGRVGFSEVLRLVGLATATRLGERRLAAYGIDVVRLRESLLLHALASEALARLVDGVDPRTAYAAGLLRALGMMALDRVARDAGGAAKGFDPAVQATYVEWERARFGVTHTEVAMTILQEWRFPPSLVAAIGGHLLFPGEGGEGGYAGVLNLAGAVVASAGLAFPGEASAWAVTPEKLAAVGLTEVQWGEAAALALSWFERQKVALF